MNPYRCGLLAVALALSACATGPSRPTAPPAAPAPKPQAAAPVAPARAATAPASNKPPVAKAPAPPEVKVLPPASYEQEKTRLKQALAKNTANTLAPDDVGYTLDVLHGRLRQEIGKSAHITRQADRIVIDLSGRLGFAHGADQVDAAGRQLLEALARVLVEYRTTFVSVLVRDSETPQPANRRALALVQILTQTGLARQRIVVIGQDTGGANADAASVARVELLIEAIVRGG
jgi:outer membrane protein OmpA-like peptidoglycan-associated protein